MKRIERLKIIKKLKKETGLDVASFKKHKWGFIIRVKEGSRYIYYNEWLKRMSGMKPVPEKRDWGFVIREEDSFTLCVPGVGESDYFKGELIEHEWWFEIHDIYYGTYLVRKDNLHPSLMCKSFKETTWGKLIDRCGEEERLVPMESIENDGFSYNDYFEGEEGLDDTLFILLRPEDNELCLCLPSMECTEFYGY